MSEHELCYCTTEDGVLIAYCDGGEGTPVIQAAPMNHVELECRFEWYEILTARRRTIWFDPRGGGSSQREVPGLSVDERALDIGAVADAVGFERFVLESELWTVPVAIAYAAKHPARVSHLVLLGAWSRGGDLWAVPRMKALFAMLDHGDWELFADTIGLSIVGWQLSEVAQQLAQVERSCRTLEQAQRFYAAVRDCDVTALLPQVTVPTLVLHPRGSSFPTLEMARKVAAAIPGARFKVLESEAGWSNEMEPFLLNALDEFIGDGGREGPDVAQPEARKVSRGVSVMATVLFTDIVSSTELTERLGDARFRELSRALDTGLRTVIREAGGEAVEGKLLGDGVLATFPSAAQAIDGARRCLALSAASELGLHIGLHAGDVIREEGNVFGGAVNIASRICGLSAPGEILVSDVVRGMARSSAGVVFEDRGEQEMKGVGEPVRVYAVRGQD